MIRTRVHISRQAFLTQSHDLGVKFFGEFRCPFRTHHATNSRDTSAQELRGHDRRNAGSKTAFAATTGQVNMLIEKARSDRGAFDIDNLNFTRQTDAVKTIFNCGNGFAANQNVFFTDGSRRKNVGVFDNRKHDDVPLKKFSTQPHPTDAENARPLP